ncbi:MAG: response regulator [Lachnospiraceae bacterium]
MIRVMVVEDDPMVMDITCKYIESIPGFQICAKAGSGGEALRLITQKPVELVVLDIYMPIMNGMEFLTKVRSMGMTVDAMLLTADNNMSMISKALQLGAVDYLIKPFSYDRFRAALEKYQKRYQLLQEQKQVTQEQLDDIFKSEAGGRENQLQKGIHGKTLEGVRAYVRSSVKETISQSEISEALSLSKVTVRRYMEYLVAVNEVVLQIEYGTVGRPTYMYKRIW